MDSGTTMRNAMSVDVEDYFQVQALSRAIERQHWDQQPRRVEANTNRILQIFADTDVKATFFMLGWIAERHPALVRKIVREGHELASHGYEHVPVFEQTPSQFRADVRKTKSMLEDLSGCPITGYRAASFSINNRNLWALEVLAEEGFSYSSSIYPIMHDFYGMPDAPRVPFHPLSNSFLEIPMTTVTVLGQRLPCSGGGYFRLLPYTVTHWAFRRVNVRDEQPCVFYFHPWEIDPDQPRIPGLQWKSRARHYLNLHRTERRLRRLLADFQWDRLDRVFGEMNDGRQLVNDQRN